MLMPGRKFFSTSEYRYGFNGQEYDCSIGIGNLDFGMRIYDSRISRFFSVDPFWKKFAENSQYKFGKNNPVYFIDFKGLEPVRDGVTNLTDMAAALKKADVKDLADLRDFFGSNFMGMDNGKGTAQKYLYSKKWGWVDMRHASFAAYKTDGIFTTKFDVLRDGEMLEYRQEMGIIPNHNKKDLNQPSVSAWDYEDLTSNLIGVGLESYLESSNSSDKDFVQNVLDYFTSLGYDSNPNSAPNFGTMPQNYNEDDQNEETEQRNYGYDPKYAPEKNKRNSEWDIELLDIQKKQENGSPDRRASIIKEVKRMYPNTSTTPKERPEKIN
jgi:RHS repeat-associated protein